MTKGNLLFETMAQIVDSSDVGIRDVHIEQ